MIITDEVFMIYFGYRPHKESFLASFESGERVSRGNKHPIFICGLIGETCGRKK